MRHGAKKACFLLAMLILTVFAQEVSAQCVVRASKDAATGDGKCPSDEVLTAGVKVDEATIREIGQRHPRFATMLASLNKTGGLKSWARVSSFPARLDASEVENWLKPPTETKVFFREYNKRHVSGAKLIVYEFTLSKHAETHAVIGVKVINGFPGDPPADGLEIELLGGHVIRWDLK